jgi:transitional endoplasmic reticulum ATPase
MPLAADEHEFPVNIEKIAAVSHGYVGADLEYLCKEAAMKCLRRLLPELNLEEEKIPPETLDKLIVNGDDFKKALVEVTPSGMREVFIENPDVSWEEIGGLAEVKRELMEAVEWPMKYPGLYDKLGHKMPRGILLHGPSGTGKTLMAKAVATESEANFVSVRGPELLSKWVGESERGIREIFKRARQSAPCVIFFDEIDSIAPIRGAGGETAVTERVVSQLLTELDGMENMHGVIVLAATNRADMIDPALLRPGRFDKIISIPLPDKDGRKKVLEIHSKDIPLADKDSADAIDFEKLAEMTDGLSSADVASIANTAVSLVVHEHLDNAAPDKNLSDEETKKVVDAIEKKAADAKVTMKHYEEAVKKVREQKDLKMNDKLVASYYR